MVIPAKYCRTSRENLILAASLTLMIVPVWIFTYFPTQDGPDHLNNAKIIYDIIFNKNSFFKDFYFVDFSSVTNSFTYALLAISIKIFGANIAQKMMASIYIIFFVISVHYALGNFKNRIYLFFPYIYSVFFNFGFFGFLYSICCFFLFHGTLWRWEKSRQTKYIYYMLAISIFTFLCHVFSLYMLIIYTTIRAGWIYYTEKYGSKNYLVPPPGISWKKLIFAPSLTLIPMFLLSFFSKEGFNLSHVAYARKLKMLGGLLVNSSLYNHNKVEMLFSFLLSSVIFLNLINILRRKEKRHNSKIEIIIFIVALCSIYLILPDAFSSYYIDHRINLYIYLALTLFIATSAINDSDIFYLKITSLSVCGALLCFNIYYYAQYNKNISSYMSVAHCVPKESLVLSLSFAHKGISEGNKDLSDRIAPMEHASGYLATINDLMTLDNYEADKQFSMVKFKPQMNPNKIIGNLDDAFYAQDKLDIGNYYLATKKPIQYLILWGHGLHKYSDMAEKELSDAISHDYKLICASDDGYTQLYELKNISVK